MLRWVRCNDYNGDHLRKFIFFGVFLGVFRSFFFFFCEKCSGFCRFFPFFDQFENGACANGRKRHLFANMSGKWVFWHGICSGSWVFGGVKGNDFLVCFWDWILAGVEGVIFEKSLWTCGNRWDWCCFFATCCFYATSMLIFCNIWWTKSSGIV